MLNADECEPETQATMDDRKPAKFLKESRSCGISLGSIEIQTCGSVLNVEQNGTLWKTD